MTDATMWKQARIDTSNSDDEFTHEDKVVRLMESESGGWGVMVANGGRSGTLESEHDSKDEAVVAFERTARELAVKHNDATY